MNMLTCLLLAVAALSSNPEITGTVVGDNGKPVSGVTVSVEPVIGGPDVGKTVTAKDGSFNFRVFPAAIMAFLRRPVRLVQCPVRSRLPTALPPSCTFD